MFSGNDIIKMAEIAIKTQSNTNINPLTITHILIVNNTYYAIKFDDLASIEKLKEIYSDIKKKKEICK